MRSVLVVCGLGVLVVVVWLAGFWLGWYGEHEGPGDVTRAVVPGEIVTQRAETQAKAAGHVEAPEPRRILFGDLHVHSTFSTDAFLWSLPFMQGTGAHPIADACDYARFCSGLDFWSINDHAEATTPRRWRETRETIRQCNAVTGDPANPDVTAFLGWEWSQVGRFPEEHYGHKNVILRDLAEDRVPERAIGAAGLATDGLRGAVGGMPPIVALVDFPHRQRYLNFIEFMNEVHEVPSCQEGVRSPDLPVDCYESAATPADLFRKLGEWGHEALVIPHGNTWGFYSPPGITWDKQLTAEQRGADWQTIIEVMSGHGNSEEYRDWRAVRFDEEGNATCPEPTREYLPSCWRAGDLVYERCRNEGGDEKACRARELEARQRYAFMGIIGNLLLPEADFEEWLDSGQCKDCFLPAFNYRPGGSTQYALAISSFDEPGDPARFRFGFIASSDNHRAKPGTGYKEFDRLETTEASGPRDETWRQRTLAPRAEFDAWEYGPEDIEEVQAAVQSMGFVALEAERQTSFFTTGGLAAVHAEGRSRDAIWNALERKEIYGTSGDRILLWFHLLDGEERLPMGSEVAMGKTPRFEVRAVGAFEQLPGCPEFTTTALSPERLERLCHGECYHPSDTRKKITRIEVVRIRPQISPDEPVGDRIEDPWKVLECEPDPAGCVATFEDPEFVETARDSVYYVRAIQEPSPSVNGKNLRCEYDDEGNCIRVNPCYGDYRTPASDDCLSEIEERAWSSPIYVDFAAGEEANETPAEAAAR